MIKTDCIIWRIKLHMKIKSSDDMKDRELLIATHDSAEASNVLVAVKEFYSERNVYYLKVDSIENMNSVDYSTAMYDF